MERTEEPPEGWTRAPVRGDEVGFRRESGGVSVAATRTTLADSDAEWELSVEHEADGSTIVEPFGRVSDRETAVGALESCMKAIDAALPDDESGAPEQLTASGMALGDVIPS